MRRSEGWPAAIRLLAEARSGSTQPALDYVREEVIGRLPNVLVEFVASTRGPTTLGVGEAERLSGRRDAQALIEQLLSLQALTFPVPGATLRVRYHGLLRAAACAAPAPGAQRAAQLRRRSRHAALPGRSARAHGRDHELADPALRRPRERTLLARADLRPGPLHREELIELLWPGAAAVRRAHGPALVRLPPAQGASTVRRAQVAIESDGETYRLALAEPSCCDALELICERRAAPSPGTTVEELESLAALVDGPFLPEWPYAEWARGLRTEVEETLPGDPRGDRPRADAAPATRVARSASIAACWRSSPNARAGTAS